MRHNKAFNWPVSGFCMGITPLEARIEHGIKPLVVALNNVSYIQTISSCEGHPDFDRENIRGCLNYGFPNVIFELEQGQEHEREFERLAAQILSKTRNLWQDVLTDIAKRYRISEGGILQHNWIIDFRPFNPHAPPHEKIRLYRMAIREASGAVESYASRRKK